MVTDIPPVPTGADEKPRVLVVDDEYGPRESIAFTLSTEFEVETASRAKEALLKISECEYAAVVMDIRMPEMDGIKALEKLRQLDAEVSVIMLTGYGTLLTAQQSMVAGANQYLRKPPDIAELLEAVRKQAAATKERRHQAKMHEEMEKRNEALKSEIAKAEPQIWQGRASVELVHDLNNPLTVVIGYAALLRDEAKSVAGTDNEQAARLQEYATVVEKAAEYCHHLSENWRLATREQVGAESVSIVSVIEEVKQVIFFSNPNIKIEGSPEIVVKGTMFELMRIFQNLLKNALEAGANDLAVTVTTEDANVLIVVADDGEGMTPEAQKKALHGGFSSKSTGTGLGLSICRHLLAVHGASMNMKSEKGVGTTITLTFPAA